MTIQDKFDLSYFEFSLPKEISLNNWIFDWNFSNDILFIDVRKSIFNEIN